MERIEQTENLAERAQAVTLLGCVVTAKRPLTWLEIQVAVSIDIEEESVDFGGPSPCSGHWHSLRIVNRKTPRRSDRACSHLSENVSPILLATSFERK